MIWELNEIIHLMCVIECLTWSKPSTDNYYFIIILSLRAGSCAKVFCLIIGGIYQIIVVFLGLETGEPLFIASEVENPGGCGRDLKIICDFFNRLWITDNFPSCLDHNCAVLDYVLK